MAIKTVAVALVLATLATRVYADPSGVAIQDQSTVDYHGNLHEHWLPLTNDGQPLESEDFYRTIGRPDLADAHSQRRTIAIGSLVGGLALTGASLYFATRGSSQPALQSCDPTQPISQFEACGQANLNATQAAGAASGANVAPAIGLALGGAVAFAVSAWYFSHPEPVSEAEAEHLANDYNQKKPVAVTPYVDGNGGGLVVAGRF